MKTLLTWLGLTSAFSALLFSFVLNIGQNSNASLIQSTKQNSVKIKTKNKNLNPMQIERYIMQGDFNSLRKISSANRSVVKKYLLNALDKIDKNYIQRLRTVDLNLGNYVDTSKSILKNKNSSYIITPLAMISSDYIYKDILEDESFVEFYKEKNIELFLEYRKSNKSDILGAFSLIKQIEFTAEVEKEIKLLFLQLVRAPESMRVLVEQSFLDSYPKLSANMKLRKYLEYALMSYSLDNIENEIKVKSYLSKMKALNPNSEFVTQFNEAILDKNVSDKEMLNKETKENSSFLSNDRFSKEKPSKGQELIAKKTSSFNFGLFLLIGIIGFYLYKTLRKPFSKKKNYLKNKKVEKEVQFDEDLSLDID